MKHTDGKKGKKEVKKGPARGVTLKKVERKQKKNLETKRRGQMPLNMSVGKEET